MSIKTMEVKEGSTTIPTMEVVLRPFNAFEMMRRLEEMEYMSLVPSGEGTSGEFTIWIGDTPTVHKLHLCDDGTYTVTTHVEV
jgi:hypothetical protein